MLHRLFATALCLFLLLASLTLCRPVWLQDLGLDFRILGDELERMDEIGRRARDLDEKRLIADQRSLTLKTIVNDLIDDRLTLMEAAQRVRPLLGEINPDVDLFFIEYPGGSTELRLCNALISWVRLTLRGTTREAGPVLTRLERELECSQLSVALTPSRSGIN